ncbi:penicillin-binding protein [Actinorhabdospora filicis]|uniref:Penicillin-binding protein n=1 Tax=Actinorhabdospora filicis TaxID=1785913 RepID=A0A9W6SGU5_9ACTN|nr:transglycosylase domain-containing protein [Actinorhabdospora filicis]GLZ76038.1 penicillin-binding protein [Actinorhabdospora filicis]
MTLEGIRKGARGAALGLRSLVRVGVIAGLLVAVMVFPLVAFGGLQLKSSVDHLQNVSQTLAMDPPPQTTYVYANDGKTLLSMFYDEFRRYVPLSDVAPVMQQAIVASEDARFYTHNGVDLKGIVRAVTANRSAGEVSQGASTLTMQYVRGALKQSAKTAEQVFAATERSSERKIREMRLAVQIEKELSKQQILERYLNQVYFGHRAYGIYAAAYIYYSKSPRDLTLPEAAMLAGLVQAPSSYDPAANDKAAATNRRNYVIDQMVKQGNVPAAEAETLKGEKIELDLRDPINSCMIPEGKDIGYGFFCDYVRHWWREQKAFGDNPRERENNLRRGGYTVITSLDPDTQEAAQKSVDKSESKNSKFALGVTTVEPGTGRVTAMAVNRTFSLDQSGNLDHSNPIARADGVRGNYPNTVNALMGGGTLAGYQAGSTFKMFTMLAALEDGKKLDHRIYAPNRVTTRYPVASGPASCGGLWCPSNASKAMTGTQTMWSGFGKSVNTYFAQLIQQVGADKAVKMAERLGLRWRSSTDKYFADPARSSGWGSFTLGVADTTPLEMANAYATLAADGIYCEATPVMKIIDSQGQELESGSPKCHRELDEEVARAATDAARCVTGYGAARGSCGGWSTAPGVYRQVGHPVAGKTGTTDQTRAAWFVGFTPYLASASFIADPDNPFHAVGDGNSMKPINAVAAALKQNGDERPEKYFTKPGNVISYGH